MERNPTCQACEEVDLVEHLVLILNIDDENVIASDAENAIKSGEAVEAEFMKGTTLIDGASETPNNLDKKSRGVSSQECPMALVNLDGILVKSYIEEQNDILKVPGAEELGVNKKFHSREDGSEAQAVNYVEILQEGRLGDGDVAKTTDLKRDKAQMNRCFTCREFSEDLVDPWKKDGCASPPVAFDAKHDLENMCSFDQVSGNGQCDEQLVLSMKDIQNENTLSKKGSEEDFSGMVDSREADEGNREETGLVNSSFERCSNSCSNKRKSRMTSLTVKPCYVLLKDISCELKEKYECCLRHPSVKKLPQRKHNKSKSSILKKLQVALYNALDKSCVKKVQESLKVQNVKALLENNKVVKAESLELNTSAKVQSSGGADSCEVYIYRDLGKSEMKDCSPDNSALNKEGIFAKFSFTESNYGNVIMDLCHTQVAEKGKEQVLVNSALIPEPHNQETRPFEFTEMLMKDQNKSTNPVEEEAASNGTDTEMFSFRFSEETFSQPSRINLIPISPGETLQTHKTNPIALSKTLLDKTDGGRTKCQASSEYETDNVLLLSVDDLKLGQKNTFPSTSKISMSEEGGIPFSVNSSVIQEDVGVDDEGMQNQSDSMSSNENDESCWILLEIDEIIRVEDPDADNKQEHREFEYDVNFPLLQSEVECPLSSDGVVDIKHPEIRKDAVPSNYQESFGGQVDWAEDTVNLASERSSPVEEEEGGPLLRQPHGVQRVFYELSGPTVRLLGTLSRNHGALRFGRLIDLEESLNEVLSGSRPTEKKQDKYGSPSRNNKRKGKRLPADVDRHEPLLTGDSRAKKKRVRKVSAPVLSSQLSQEQSRIKVFDAFREVLERRLDQCPDLNVQKNTVLRIAKKLEREIFRVFNCVDMRYKQKYRSLLFNLRATDNQPFFHKVILGEITPKQLVQMSFLEMAPKKLAEWRVEENKNVLEAIEKEEREAPNYCPTKFTHKGILEIHREADEDLIFQEIFGSQLLEEESCGYEAPIAPVSDQNNNNPNHDNSSCVEQKAVDNEGGPKPFKSILKRTAKASKHFLSTAIYSDTGERSLKEESPKKRRQIEKQCRTSAIWRGLIQMFSLKQFVAKAYPVSGSNCHLFKALPQLIESRGCILPEDVWTYLESIWPASTKEMGVIRFHPTLTEGISSYNLLYSYLNDKQRYGIVASSEIEMFMVPVAAYQPVPAKLHPLGGPGLDPCHRSLLLGLILPKRPPLGASTVRLDPLRKSKHVTFKSTVETKCFGSPSCSEVDASQTWPSQQLRFSKPLCANESPPLPGVSTPDPLLLETVLPLSEEEFSREARCDDGLSPLHPTEAVGQTSQASFDDVLQLLSGSLWAGGQVSSSILETVGEHLHQARDHSSIDSDQLNAWSSLGLLPSEQEWPNQSGTNILNSTVLTNAFCPETVLPCEMSQLSLPAQFLCTRPVAGEPTSLEEETRSLIQQVTQLQSQFQSQETAFSLPIMPQEDVSSALEFPSVKPDDDVHIQLQLLLATLEGQTELPSAF